MLYAINLGIEDDKRDYTKLYEKIMTLGSWMHYVDYTWVIQPRSADATAKSIATELLPHIDKENDYMMVVALGNDSSGWLPDDAWSWLKDKGAVARDIGEAPGSGTYCCTRCNSRVTLNAADRLPPCPSCGPNQLVSYVRC